MKTESFWVTRNKDAYMYMLWSGEKPDYIDRPGEEHLDGWYTFNESVFLGKLPTRGCEELFGVKMKGGPSSIRKVTITGIEVEKVK